MLYVVYVRRCWGHIVAGHLLGSNPSLTTAQREKKETFYSCFYHAGSADRRVCSGARALHRVEPSDTLGFRSHWSTMNVSNRY